MRRRIVALYVGNVRWHIVALLFVVSFVAYVLRTNMSVAGEKMMPDLGLTKVQLGLVMAAFAWGYAIFQIPGGIFGDRFGGRRALTQIALAWGGLNLLVGLLPPAGVLPTTAVLATLVVLRFLMGATQAPLFPITGRVFYNWFPASSWALPNGLTNTGLTFGAAATGPLITWLAETIGWRQSFLVTAPLGFLIAAAWWWYARDRPGEHASVSVEEVALIEADRAPAPAESAGWASWRSVLRNRNVVLLAVSYFCSNYVFYFFFNWLFIYLVEVRGFKALEGGLYAMWPWVMGAIGAAVGGWLADRMTVRVGPREGYRIPSMLALVAVAGLIFAAATARDPVVAVVFLSLCLGLQQLTEGAYWAATIAVSGRHAATGCGVLNTGGNIVGGIGALMVPFTAERLGWVPALGTASVFAVLAAALWLWIRADEQAHA
ncbi:MAG TPA: MFS transporter [Gemmatimonadales bacterium]|nr:MFS transporter [Gemmatimonadales bacterium]